VEVYYSQGNLTNGWVDESILATFYTSEYRSLTSGHGWTILPVGETPSRTYCIK